MIKDSYYMLLSSILRLLSGVLVFVVLARIWGAHTFGTFMYPFTVSALIVILVDYGFSIQLVRDIPRDPGQVKQIVRDAIYTKLFLSTLLIIVVIASLFIMKPEGHLVALLILLTLAAIANSFGVLLNLPFRGLGKFEGETRVVTVSNLVHFPLVVIVAWIASSPIAVAGGFLVSRLFYLLLSWKAYDRLVVNLPAKKYTGVKLASTLKAGFPFGVHVALGTLYFQIDTIVIQHFLGTEAVGIYQAPMRILIGGMMLLEVFSNVYLPRLSRAGNNRDLLVKIGCQMTRYLVAIGAVGATVIIAVAEPAVNVLFGDGYKPAIQLLMSLSIVFFLRYFGGSYGTMLTVADRQDVRAAGVALALVVNLALNVVLIPMFGLNGAVAASVLTHIVLAGIYMVFAWFHIHSMIMEKRVLFLLLLFVLGNCMAVGISHFVAVYSPWTRFIFGMLLAVLLSVVAVQRSEWVDLSGRIGRRGRQIS